MSSENFIWIPSLEQSDEGLFALIRDERYTITGNNKENNKGREREREREREDEKSRSIVQNSTGRV